MTDNDDAQSNCAKIREAVKNTRAEDKGRKAAIIKMAVDEGCIAEIPDDWEVEVDE